MNFDLRKEYLALSVLLDELVHRVAVGYPADHAGVVGQRHDRISLDAQVHASRRPLARQQRVHQAEQLHHALVLPQIFSTLEQEQVRSTISCGYARKRIKKRSIFVLGRRKNVS